MKIVERNAETGREYILAEDVPQAFSQFMLDALRSYVPSDSVHRFELVGDEYESQPDATLRLLSNA